MEEENKIQKLKEYLKKYQTQNNILAKAINNIKYELRKSKDEIISLNRQLQDEREKSIGLETEQSEIFDCVDKVEELLDKTFRQHADGYSELSSKISEIKSKNPKNRTNDLNCAFDLNHTFDASDPSEIDELSTTFQANKVTDVRNEQFESNSSKDNLNSTILFDSDYVSDESMCQECRVIVETITLPESITKSTAMDNLNEILSSRGRPVKRIDYCEGSISRKIRRSQ